MEMPDAPNAADSPGFPLRNRNSRGYLKSRDEIGTGHAALNPRSHQADPETTLPRPADELVPDFTEWGNKTVRKTILTTGSTDGLGLEAARLLYSQDNGPVCVAVNPGSLLATKMAKEGFGMAGKEIRIGADTMVRAALSDEFSAASGLYFDNDKGRFASPHPDGLDPRKCQEVVRVVDTILVEKTQSGQIGVQ